MEMVIHKYPLLVKKAKTQEFEVDTKAKFMCIKNQAQVSNIDINPPVMYLLVPKKSESTNKLRIKLHYIYTGEEVPNELQDRYIETFVYVVSGLQFVIHVYGETEYVQGYNVEEYETFF